MAMRLAIVSAGRRVPLLAEAQGGIPDPYVAAYTLIKLRRSDLNTVRNIVGGISKCLRFCAQAGVDLPARCRAGKLVTTGELERLVEHLKGGATNELTTARPNFTAFADYVLWLDQEFARQAERDGILRLFSDRSRFTLDVDDLKPSVVTAGKGPVLGFDEEQRRLFLSVIIPIHPRNPFFEYTGFRNFVFMSASYVLGLRTGELLGLKLEDLKLEGETPLLQIKVRPRDPGDTRHWPADQKTQERDLPLGDDLVKSFRVLLKRRKSFPAAKRHQYIFINKDGEPLGHRGARLQYQVLREAVPGLEKLINHLLRHDWNDRWIKMCKETGVAPEQMAREQRYAMGWTIDSKMVHRYGEAERRRQANTHFIESQKRALRDKPDFGDD